jgi:CRISPR-associated protein Cas5t
MIDRFGGLSLGESTHLVDEIWLLDPAHEERLRNRTAQMYVLEPRGLLTLPVWVDHVGGAKTRFATGRLLAQPALDRPAVELLPRIDCA